MTEREQAISAWGEKLERWIEQERRNQLSTLILCRACASARFTDLPQTVQETFAVAEQNSVAVGGGAYLDVAVAGDLMGYMGAFAELSTLCRNHPKLNPDNPETVQRMPVVDWVLKIWRISQTGMRGPGKLPQFALDPGIEMSISGKALKGAIDANGSAFAVATEHRKRMEQSLAQYGWWSIIPDLRAESIATLQAISLQLANVRPARTTPQVKKPSREEKKYLNLLEDYHNWQQSQFDLTGRERFNGADWLEAQDNWPKRSKNFFKERDQDRESDSDFDGSDLLAQLLDNARKIRLKYYGNDETSKPNLFKPLFKREKQILPK